MRVLSILLALTLVCGALFALKNLDTSQRPEAIAFAALNQSKPEIEKAVQLFTEAVRRDSANPYHWSDLGQALLASGDTEKARLCYRRALELGPQVPQVWLIDANFHFQLDEPEDALHSASRVLKSVPDYDAVLFGYLDRFMISPSEVLAEIGEDRRATRSYVQHLVAIGNTDGASPAWSQALAKGFLDDPLTASYIDALLRAHRYSEAQQDWARSLGTNRGDYPDRNLLFNGSFEREPSGCAFDWRIQHSDAFETSRDSVGHDGMWALKIEFRGNANVSYSNVTQWARILPGNYSLHAWVRTQAITTNEGPRIEIQDTESPIRLNLKSDPFLGSRDWTYIAMPFTVGPHTKLIAVRVIRELSQKFDNKISGTLWVDSISIKRNGE